MLWLLPWCSHVCKVNTWCHQVAFSIFLEIDKFWKVENLQNAVFFFCAYMQTKPLRDIPAQSNICSAMLQLLWRGASTITLHTQVIWFDLYDYWYVPYLEDPYWNNFMSGFILSSKHEWLLCKQAWWKRQEKLRQMYIGRYPAHRWGHFSHVVLFVRKFWCL